MRKFKEIIYKTLPYLPEIFIVSLCIVSLCASFTALNKAQRNEKGIVALQEEVSKLVKSQIHLQEELSRNIEAIDAHISIIEKYAAANYNFFYGDGVKQKIKGDPQIIEVDPNNVLKHSKPSKNEKSKE